MLGFQQWFPISVGRMFSRCSTCVVVAACSGCLRLAWRTRGEPWSSRKFSSHRLLHRDAAVRPGTEQISAITLLTPETSLVDPAAVISNLPVLPRTSRSFQNVPILLATPALAAWAHARSTLLPSIMGHIFQDALRTDEEIKDIYSISAVVDKLPIPAGLVSSARSASPEDSPAFEKEGCEGISLLIADQESLSGDIVRPMRRRDVSMPEIEPTITYAMTYEQDGGEKVSTEVGVRIANTIFVTGTPRTMLASRWRFDEEIGKLKPKETKDLVICRIESNANSSVTPFIPLHPVTQPRKVITSMGNVLSQISTGNGSTKSAPASAELEKALPAYIDKHQLQNRRLAVWALVKPEELHCSSEASPEASGTDDVSNAIKKSARLHRLMSGGGGWGKKQGLLSLDPEYSYQEEHSSGHRRPINELFERNTIEPDIEQTAFDSFPSFMEFNNGKLVTPLSEAAKPGDTVQFFVAPLDTAVPIHSPLGHTNSSQGSQPAEVAERFTFGVIPSVETASVPVAGLENDLRSSTQVSDKHLIVVPNHFGALSENGITFTTFEQDSLTGADERALEVSGTKIDVPGSRISIRTQFK
ncbi:hypothetical protein D8B26_002714 [Coccidioides posadasii str. Silveira]|uniref:uncharacterized protein n=1 Tax=Coccidioides posadasii (strain RMSCC 757 / Silveira) TaxID=443226 RepID=UPI001BEE93BC|nr:hypothetical protein D8B26_002714 [Coccidioides posadasii str. Silveira]